MRLLKAIVDEDGSVRLLEKADLRSGQRVLVSILDDDEECHEAAVLSEAALARDWDRGEEDEAWRHLQPVP